MNIQIVTDSTSDIPESTLNKLPITRVPLYIVMNGQSYQDIVDLSRAEFYQQLPTAHPHPTTAAPSPEQFTRTYDNLADQGADAIFSIHISASLSAVFQSVKTAADSYTRIPVHAVDSGTLTLAEGLLVIRAAEAALEGQSEQDIAVLLEQLIPRAHAYAKLDTIDYLLRGGRMSSIQHSVISLLGIKPILKMSNHVSKMEIARTKNKAFEKVLKMAQSVLPSAKSFGISHADALDQAQELVRLLKADLPDLPDPLISEVTPALGAHVGPGSLCVNWIDDEDLQDQPEKKGWRERLADITSK